MKRMIKSGSLPRTDRDDLFDLVDTLEDASVTEHTMLRHFFDYLPAKDCIEVLKDLAVQCDIDLDEEE